MNKPAFIINNICLDTSCKLRVAGLHLFCYLSDSTCCAALLLLGTQLLRAFVIEFEKKQLKHAINQVVNCSTDDNTVAVVNDKEVCSGIKTSCQCFLGHLICFIYFQIKWTLECQIQETFLQYLVILLWHQR